MYSVQGNERVYELVFPVRVFTKICMAAGLSWRLSFKPWEENGVVNVGNSKCGELVTSG
jgi:hypothetical protein